MNILDRAAKLAREGQPDAAFNLVSTTVRGGGPNAMFTVALLRLWGEYGPRDLDEMHRLLNQAAALGHVEARLLRASLVANGTGVPADWPRAVGMLSNIDAESARVQLNLLAAMCLASNGGPQGDLPARRPLCDAPEVSLIPGFASSAECAYLMAASDPRLEPSTIVDNNGRSILNPIRTSDGTSFGPAHEDLVVRAINMRIAAATATDVRQGEPIHILRYRPGQQYRPHLDAIHGLQNQRIATLLIFLNDEFEGGETFFSAPELTIRPKTGDAVMFRNVDAAGRPDLKSEHAGLPVRSGVKWLATRWIRGEFYHPWGLRQDIAA